MIGIYLITNKINKKEYVGQSIDIEDRWKQHIYKAFNQNEKAYNSIIHQAFRKYGIENFELSVLEECDIDNLDEKEIYWIKERNSLAPFGYNILTGGQKKRVTNRNCPFCGKIISRGAEKCQECYKKEKSSHIPSKEVLLKMLEDNNGNFSAVGRIYNVTSNAIRRWCKKYDLSIYSIDYKKVIEKKPFKKRVQQIDIITNEVIAEFDSTNDAARSLGKKKGSHISEVCNGKLKTAYGYKWKYKE